MVSAERRKRDIVNLINQNPEELEISHKTYNLIDGARIPTTEYTTVIGRVFMHSAWNQFQRVDRAGTMNSSGTFGILLSTDIDLKDTAIEDIEIKALVGKLRVTGIYPQFVRGEICGYQIDVERKT